MENEIEDYDRIAHVRRMARKLAANRSSKRVIRKLPRTIQIVKVRPKRAVHLRKAVNSHKRLTYILLLGAVMCAYIYDVDQATLEAMLQAVGHAAQSLGLRST